MNYNIIIEKFFWKKGYKIKYYNILFYFCNFIVILKYN